jgi:protein-S-isoprenylcysteine O-methyltransferase Ste14
VDGVVVGPNSSLDAVVWSSPCWMLGFTARLDISQSGQESYRDTVVTRKEHTLVTTGPYRYVRHPFYLAFFIAALGGSLIAANWFLLLASLLPIGFLVARTPIEEEKLIERFGNDYRQYMSATGRFFPKLNVGSKPDQ